MSVDVYLNKNKNKITCLSLLRSLTEGMPVLHLLHGSAEGCVPVGKSLAACEHVGSEDELADQFIWNTTTHFTSPVVVSK
jgi:hypothetical protein